MCRLRTGGSLQQVADRMRVRIVLFSLSFFLSACSPPVSVSPPRLAKALNVGAETTHQSSEQFLQEMIAEERFSGVALVMRGANVVHARAYGPASPGAANRLDTAFHVGSVTKQFTAAAILKLVDQDVLDLDSPVNDYLPEQYRSDKWSSVTVRHLLSHTSGIPDYAESRDYYEVVDGWAFGTTVEGMIREAMGKELQFAAGTDFFYSNIGFTLLGEIIQEQSEQTYAAFIQDNVLNPIGMTNSLIHVEGRIPKLNEASGLRWDEESDQYVKDDILSLPVTPPDGGLVTTLDDFIKWIAVYRDFKHPNLSATSIECMMLQSIPPGSYLWPDQGLRGEAAYGFGLSLSGDLIMHEGYIVGFRSHFIYSRNDDLLVVLFTNNTSNNVFRISAGLLEIHQ